MLLEIFCYFVPYKCSIDFNYDNKISLYNNK